MDKLDQLLALYTGRCVDDEAEYFLSVDVSGIEYNEEIKKRMLRYAFKRSRYERKRYAVKVILVACLVAMSVVFTACVSIPKIREAIWGAVIEWYDDYVSVNFEEITEQTVETSKSTKANENQSSGEIPDETAANTNAEEMLVPPKTIERKAYIADLPEGYYVEEAIVLSGYYVINIYNDKQEMQYTLTQTILDSVHARLDSENENVIELKINNHAAILLEDTEYINVYTLLWTDGEYSYTIYGNFESLHDLAHTVTLVSLEE